MKKVFLKFLLFIFLLTPLIYSGVLTLTLPNHLTENTNTNQAIVLLDRFGNKLRTYNPNETYDWIHLEEVPKELINLVLLAEDQNFYAHEGIDVLGTIRSFWINLKAMRIVSGASTITQQSYRLSHSLPRTLVGKIKSIIGALLVERNYSKEKILEHYLNAIPLGKRIVGMKRGSEVFFAKDIQLLSLAELATLAVLPRAPSHLQNGFERKKLLNLRNNLLDRYKKKFHIDPILISLEKNVPLELNNDQTGWDNYHFANRVIEQKDLSEFINQNGRVRTTLDQYLQKEASSILKAQIKKLQKFQVNNGAIMVIDNKHGEVLAYVGSSDVLGEIGGQYDALLVPRQVGSTLKPFTYAYALQQGMSLNKVLPDIPSYYKTGIGQFLPRNYDKEFSGPRLMREALANSLNLPAVAMADEIGVHNLYRFFKEVGIPLSRDADHYGVGLTLGNAEISPFDLLTAYTVFPRMGTTVKPKFFMDQSSSERETPLNKENAFLINHVLDDRVARREAFGERNVFDLPFTLSVKTGTSTDFRDNWAVGYNDLFSIIVWIGNMDQKPMKRVSGITGAGPVLSEVAKYLSHKYSIPKLRNLKEIEQRTICALSGQAFGKNCQHKKIEYFKQSDAPLKNCEYHQEYIVRNCHEEDDREKVSLIQLPEQYASYMSEHPEWSIEGQLANLCESGTAKASKINNQNIKTKLAIIRPLHGSFYAVDPNIPLKYQKLKVELNQVSNIKKVIWKIDQEQEIQDDSILDWNMKKGKHHFSADVEYEDGHQEKTSPIQVTIL